MIIVNGNTYDFSLTFCKYRFFKFCLTLYLAGPEKFLQKIHSLHNMSIFDVV